MTRPDRPAKLSAAVTRLRTAADPEHGTPVRIFPASFVRRPTSGRDPHPLTEPSAKADGAFGKPLAAVSTAPVPY